MTSHGFRLQKETSVDSLNLTVRSFRHVATGARHFHFDADDQNNAFLVAFLTVPEDSTGVAHILEHTSLCGSERFPVRDPFFMMIRRSLNTFMNAFTASDWTAYPFASQNRKDFNNLLEVYLDAVFFPLLDPLDFAQEGHRLEFSLSDDITSPLEYKGVVYNEMKGAMSTPTSQVAQVLQSFLFPTTTYHNNSGGDPASIPNLTHADLKAFHTRHYHPSNAVFMTYGNFPPEEHQERIEQLALSRFGEQLVTIEVGDEVRFSKPITEEGKYATHDTELSEKTHIVLGWLMHKTTDAVANMEARILAGVLLDNSASPIRRALETSPLGTAPSELCGLDDSSREATFVCGLEGCNPAQASEVEALILETLEKVATEGIPDETATAVIHQVELGQREIGGGFPYGLQLMIRALSPALYGGDPMEALDIEPVLENLRQRAKDPEFIPQLIRRLLLENPHRVRLTMAPDPDMQHQKQTQERAHLEAISKNLSNDARRQIVELAKRLKARQETEDDPERLPKVTILDVPDELPIPEPNGTYETPIKTVVYAPSTNGLVYVQLVADLPQLEPEQRAVLPLFCDFFTDVGAGVHDYLEMQMRQASVSGGIRARTSFRSPVHSLEHPKAYFVLAGKALARNQSALIELLRDTFHGARFDELDRLRELVSQARVHAESQITDSGHSLALIAASAGFSRCAALEHEWGGLAGLRRLQLLDDSIRNPDVLERLGASFTALRERLNSCPREVLLVAEPSTTSSLYDTFTAKWGHFNQKAPDGTALSKHRPRFTPAKISSAWTTNTQVNFCAHAYPAPPQGHPDAAPLRVLGGYMRNGYLHRAIREQGGAYGAGAGYSADAGAFRFFSYRDPRLEDTLSDFRRSIEWLLKGDHPERLLEEAILGVVGEIDRPDSPAGEASIAYFSTLHGRSNRERRAFRQRTLQVKKSDLNRVCELYLANTDPSVCVVTSTDALNGAPALSEFDRHST